MRLTTEDKLMVIFQSVTVMIMLSTAVVLHITAQLCHGIVAKILAIVNICLHIGLIFPLVFGEIPISEAVLCYMFSVFVYTAMFFVRHMISRPTAEGEEDSRDL